MREALTARFIAKGIPEPLYVRRVAILALTLFSFTSKAIEKARLH